MKGEIFKNFFWGKYVTPFTCDMCNNFILIRIGFNYDFICRNFSYYTLFSNGNLPFYLQILEIIQRTYLFNNKLMSIWGYSRESKNQKYIIYRTEKDRNDLLKFYVHI